MVAGVGYSLIHHGLGITFFRDGNAPHGHVLLISTLRIDTFAIVEQGEPAIVYVASNFIE